jgi:hypothetical protein
MKNTGKKNWNHVYLMLHVREEDTENEDVKTIGIYTTRSNAIKAKKMLSKKPGFNKPKGRFYISKYALDKTFWVEGFVW